MVKLSKQFKAFQAFIRRSLIILKHRANHHNHFRLDLWHQQSRLAQSPSGPRPAQAGRVNPYAGPALHPKTHKYRPEEVKRILRGLEKGERARPVLAQAATFSTLLEERMVRHFRGRERLFDKLPFVLYQYTQGRPCDEIAHSVSFFSDGDDVEEAIDFAARLITNQVNRQRW